MKILISLLLTVFLYIPTQAQYNPFEPKEGPQFQYASNDIEIVEAKVNETSEFIFVFKNNGTETLLFKRQNATTKRISLETPEEVEPGENGEIKILFTPTIARDYKETIYIETNSQLRPIILYFKGTANI